jgi:hypothetical protein
LKTRSGKSSPDILTGIRAALVSVRPVRARSPYDPRSCLRLPRSARMMSPPRTALSCPRSTAFALARVLPSTGYEIEFFQRLLAFGGMFGIVPLFHVVAGPIGAPPTPLRVRDAARRSSVLGQVYSRPASRFLAQLSPSRRRYSQRATFMVSHSRSTGRGWISVVA